MEMPSTRCRGTHVNGRTIGVAEQRRLTVLKILRYAEQRERGIDNLCLSLIRIQNVPVLKTAPAVGLVKSFGLTS